MEIPTPAIYIDILASRLLRTVCERASGISLAMLLRNPPAGQVPPFTELRAVESLEHQTLWARAKQTESHLPQLAPLLFPSAVRP